MIHKNESFWYYSAVISYLPTVSLFKKLGSKFESCPPYGDRPKAVLVGFNRQLFEKPALFSAVAALRAVTKIRNTDKTVFILAILSVLPSVNRRSVRIRPQILHLLLL